MINGQFYADSELAFQESQAVILLETINSSKHIDNWNSSMDFFQSHGPFYRVLCMVYQRQKSLKPFDGENRNIWENKVNSMAANGLPLKSPNHQETWYYYMI